MVCRCLQKERGRYVHPGRSLDRGVCPSTCVFFLATGKGCGLQLLIFFVLLCTWPALGANQRSAHRQFHLARRPVFLHLLCKLELGGSGVAGHTAHYHHHHHQYCGRPCVIPYGWENPICRFMYGIFHRVKPAPGHAFFGVAVTPGT